MGKHRQQGTAVRNAVAIAAAGAGLAALAPATANAAPITVPNTDIAVNAPDEVSKQVQPHIDNAHKQAQSQIANAQKQAERMGLVKQADVPAQPAQKPAPKKSHVSIGQKIANHAMSKVGAPYAWGAAGPDAFDCSGLTSWAYKQVGKAIPRTSQDQAYGGKAVAINDLRPGDIVSYYGGASHVAIYIGKGKVVQALNEGSPVQVNDLHYMPVNNAVRF